MKDFEVRYTTDGPPLGVFSTLKLAEQFAINRAKARGMGPYLVYEISETGERYLGEAG